MSQESQYSEETSQKDVKKDPIEIEQTDEHQPQEQIDPEQFQRIDSQIKIDQIKSKAVLDAIEWLDYKKCRKCRDIASLVIYVACWALTIYLAFFSKYKILGLQSKISLYMTPADDLRRQCGKSTAQQSDPIAADYSSFIDTRYKSAEFCSLYKEMNINQSDLLKDFDCSQLQTDPQTLPESQKAAARQKSIDFYNIMRYIYSDMTEYDVGYDVATTICVRNNTLGKIELQYTQIPNLAGINDTTNETYEKNTICLPKNNLVFDPNNVTELTEVQDNINYVCHREIIDVIEFIRKQNFDASMTSDRIVLDTARDSQFITEDQFNSLMNLINAYSQNLAFLSNLCTQMPSNLVLNYFQLYIPQTFTVDAYYKCVVNYNNAIQRTSGTFDMVAIYLQYLSQAFGQMIPSAMMELDLSWKNLAISLSMTIVFTVFYQVCMYFLVKIIIYISLVGVVAGAGYFTYYLFNYAAKIGSMNATYFKQFGSYNSTYQLQQILFYCGGAIMIILLILIFSISCVLFNLADAIAKTIKVAQTTFKKIWGVSLLPFVLIIVCLIHIVFFIVVLFLFQTTGRFDARVVTFNFVSQNLGEARNYDTIKILIMIFYVLMLVHGVFLCVNLIEFVVSTSTIQHYFFNRNNAKGPKLYVFKSIGWMFAQFGSLVFEAFLTIFLIWLRPIFQVISSSFPHLPEQRFLRVLVRFSRNYISLCSRETIYSIGFTGQSTLKSAKKWKEFMHADRDIANTLSSILSVFLTICNLCISLTTWSITKLIKAYTNSDLVQSISFIWISIISFILGYLISSFVTNLTDYILSTILYCWSFEAVVGANKIICEPEDFRNLRAYAQEQKQE
ncbi:Plasma-membrane_choline transporter [Hexamita inflata]|uniref:Plasma-membrane choline transporter n=1 Tax=Hexamita inflata TaxID=28002 RepID=A0AA86NX17_9EUKA|nr:Plasma-membrane choline transporter [Hexamita inflata]